MGQGDDIPPTDLDTNPEKLRTKKGRARYTRAYFYTVCSSGGVFLADAKHKNYATAYRDKVFLRDLFGRLRVNDTGLYNPPFPYVSPCGRELNFVVPEDPLTPYVFHSLTTAPPSAIALSQKRITPSHKHKTQETGEEGEGEEEREVDVLVYGGDSFVEFEPDKLWIDAETGRMYHPSPDADLPGLVGDKLSMSLSLRVGCDEQGGEEGVILTVGGGVDHFVPMR